MQISFILCNFASIRFSTSYHNKAICRRTLILRALFGGLYCFSVGAILVNSWSMFSQLPVQFQNYQHPFVPYKKSRRADCLAGRGKTIIFLFYQRVNSYTKRFLERFETGAICNSCVFSSHTFLNCLNGFLIGIVSEKLIF